MIKSAPWRIASTNKKVVMPYATEEAQTAICVADTEDHARLIAAAPELLEALQTIMEMDVKGHQLQDRLQFSISGRAILNKARSAITKATGEA